MRKTGWVRARRHRGKTYVPVDSPVERPRLRAFVVGALVMGLLIVIGVIVVPALRTPAETTPSDPPATTRPRSPAMPIDRPKQSYIIQVASKSDFKTADRIADQLREQGFPKVGVLRSSEYGAPVLNIPGLRPGFYVTFVGPWELTEKGRAEARAAKRRLPKSADFRGSFVRPIKPG